MGAFRKIAKSDFYIRDVCLSLGLCVSVCLSVSSSASNNSATNGQIFMKFDIWTFFENLPRKFKLR